MIKKIFNIVLLLSALIFIRSCGSGVSRSKPEGWINNDTFRVLGMGSPSDNTDDKFRREVESKQAAELDAKK